MSVTAQAVGFVLALIPVGLLIGYLFGPKNGKVCRSTGLMLVCCLAVTLVTNGLLFLHWGLL